MAKRKKKPQPQEYSGDVELRLPTATMVGLQEIALASEESVQTVIKVIMALYTRQHRIAQGKPAVNNGEKS